MNRLRKYYGVPNGDDNVFKDEAESKFQADEGTNGPETKNGIITNSLLVSVRKGPSYESDVLEVLQKGDKVVILGEDKNSFLKVSTKLNKVAYIFSNYVREE